MAEYGKLLKSLWHSKRFRSLKSIEAKLFYCYLHTNTHRNSIGCYWLPKAYIKHDMDVSDKVIDRAINRCIDTGLVHFQPEDEIVFIHKFLDANPITNSKHGTAAVRLINDLPEGECKRLAIDSVLGNPMVPEDLIPQEWLSAVGSNNPLGTDTPTDSPMHTTMTETETETYISFPNGNSHFDENDLTDAAFKIYNEVASSAGWPLCQKKTKTRRSRIRQRLKDCGSLEAWKSNLEKASKMRWMSGENDRGWWANIDFFLQESSFTKLMEGTYHSATVDYDSILEGLGNG